MFRKKWSCCIEIQISNFSGKIRNSGNPGPSFLKKTTIAGSGAVALTRDRAHAPSSLSLPDQCTSPTDV